MAVIKMSEWADFCISKCGEGYCDWGKGEGGYPCLEFQCAFCKKKSVENCKFCKGE